MTPAARIQAAIDVLDGILAGTPAEKTLTNWARRSRFAGSGDRVAVRDLVFDALRCRRSYGWLGGADSGRGLMIGKLRAEDTDLETVFTGEGYAPARLSVAETASGVLQDAPLPVQLDVPDWLLDPFRRSLGSDMAMVLRIMRSRAPVFARVNLRICTREDAAADLAREEIETQPHPLSPSALEVRTKTRRIQGSKAFTKGWVELQDAASQAVADALEIPPQARVLDYCAGGGGKALAIAAQFDARVFAHDADPARMRDIPMRAERAGVMISQLDAQALQKEAAFDFVLCDVPCSGSGAWRRSPEAKWRLTPAHLAQLCALQSEILETAAGLVAKGGVLAYATCSLLEVENGAQIQAFLAKDRCFELITERRLTPLDGGDGFYVAQMCRLTTLP